MYVGSFGELINANDLDNLKYKLCLHKSNVSVYKLKRAHCWIKGNKKVGLVAKDEYKKNVRLH